MLSSGNASPAQMLASLPDDVRQGVLDKLDPDVRDRLAEEWEFWARPSQLARKSGWRTHLYLGGRGAGKTRAGGGWVNGVVRDCGPKSDLRIALIAPTAADVRDVMLFGESGLVTTAPSYMKPVHYPSKRLVVWPNGAIGTTFSAEDPESLRGHQFHMGWLDEPLNYSHLQETWDMYQFCLRLGTDPRTFLTTTPKPHKWLIDLATVAAREQELEDRLKAEGKPIPDRTVVMVKASTMDNASNLASQFLSQIMNRYKGTRLGRQEIDAEILVESDKALWRRETIDANRISRDGAPSLEEYERIVIAIDPAVTAMEQSDETGFIIAGRLPNGHVHVLSDQSGRMKPHQWATKAVVAYNTWSANSIVAERNNGGDMIEHTIRTVPGGENVSIRTVFASRGKYTRAEPVAALYEQGVIKHVGIFDQLELQMTGFDPMSGEKSPDRYDALVWAITDLKLTGAQHKFW